MQPARKRLSREVPSSSLEALAHVTVRLELQFGVVTACEPRSRRTSGVEREGMSRLATPAIQNARSAQTGESAFKGGLQLSGGTKPTGDSNRNRSFEGGSCGGNSARKSLSRSRVLFRGRSVSPNTSVYMYTEIDVYTCGLAGGASQDGKSGQLGGPREYREAVAAAKAPMAFTWDVGQSGMTRWP